MSVARFAATRYGRQPSPMGARAISISSCGRGSVTGSAFVSYGAAVAARFASVSAFVSVWSIHAARSYTPRRMTTVCLIGKIHLRRKYSVSTRR